MTKPQEKPGEVERCDFCPKPATKHESTTWMRTGETASWPVCDDCAIKSPARQPAAPAEMPKPAMTASEYAEWSDHRIQDLESALAASEARALQLWDGLSFKQHQYEIENIAWSRAREEIATSEARTAELQAERDTLATQAENAVADCYDMQDQLSAAQAEIARLRAAIEHVLHNWCTSGTIVESVLRSALAYDPTKGDT